MNKEELPEEERQESEKRPLSPAGSYVSLDLETTGLDPKRDKIIEIGAVKVLQGRPAGRFASLVNPARGVGESSEKLTGITDAMTAAAPYIEEVLPELMDFLEELPLLGHSVLFDYSFLKRAAVNAGYSLERDGVDTLRLARRFLPDLESRSLPFLCKHYGIPHQAHRAPEDAEATRLLYEKLWEEFGEREPKLWAARPLIYQVKREGPASAQQKQRLYRLLQRHKITTDVDIERLTRNEASRLTDQIRAKYGLM